MAKKPDSQNPSRDRRKAAGREDSPNGSARGANANDSSRSAAKGKSGSQPSAGARAASAGRKANGASAGGTAKSTRRDRTANGKSRAPTANGSSRAPAANGKSRAPTAKGKKSKAPTAKGASVARGANGSRRGDSANGNGASHAGVDRTIALTLTSAQIRQILHAAGGVETELASLLDGSVITADALSLETWEGRYRQELDAGSASSSLLRGLLILACFPRDGTRRSVHWVAEHTGMEMSTTHRYIRTLLLLGFLEQDPKTRAYSRVAV
ncbi:MAG TPA: helix-turn-helix domain-containing protein [Solirubrobacteraceae bacterium]|nr:helix-turn-helix domain-containing protein [Solirubrobacteraceae bacterium]